MSILSRLRGWLFSPAPLALPEAQPTQPRTETWTQLFLEEVLGFLRGAPSRRGETRMRSLRLPEPFPGVLPKDGPKMAADSQIAAVYNYGAAYAWDGYGFMGYALLSDLAQIPEYRKPSEILANEMTRKWIKLVSTSEDDKTEKLKDLEDELKRLGVQEAFRRAFEVDNFFGRAQIFIDLGVEGSELKNPVILDTNVEKGSLKAIRVIEPIWTYPNNYNSIDPLAPDFYRPQTWFVLSKEIHTSRLLTFVSRPVPDMLKPAYLFGGVSLTQLLQPYVDNWLRTRQSVSNITHNFSVPVLETDMAKVTQPGGAQILATRADVFNTSRDNQGLFIVDKAKEGFDIKAAPLGSLDKLQAQAQEQMASITGIPLVKMFGIQPTGLNASSDGEIRVFYDTIESTQERTGTPELRRLLNIIQMSKYGAIDPDITFIWEPLWSLDEKALAEVRKINAETDCAYVDHSILDTSEVRKTIAAEEDSRYASIDADVLPELPDEEDPGEGDDRDEGIRDAPDAPDAHLRNSGARENQA